MVVLYRSKSEHGRAVEEYIREFERRTSAKLDVKEADTPEAAQLCELYDVTTYPAILALADDGQLQHLWLGQPLPLMDEVAGYALAA